MDYLVIELKDKPYICTKDGEPIIFKAKQDAFRYADTCKKGLVYPIIDIMPILDQIKVIAKGRRDYQIKDNGAYDILDRLLAITDEII